jgi:hypothetical protein
VFFKRGIPKYEGVPHELWTTKCVSLHSSNGNVKSDLVIRSSGPLGDTHVDV